MNQLLKKLLILSINCVTLFHICSGQIIGQKKTSTLIFKGTDNETQIGGFFFNDPLKNAKVNISNNQFISEKNFYTGIPTESLNNYVGQKLDVEFIYMVHLCSEGSYNFPCTGWVVTSINKVGTKPPSRKINLPIVGLVNDPDGYVNVRAGMSKNSSIVGKLEPEFIDREAFYFYRTSDVNWLKVDMDELKGYIHKSRIKIITN